MRLWRTRHVPLHYNNEFLGSNASVGETVGGGGDGGNQRAAHICQMYRVHSTAMYRARGTCSEVDGGEFKVEIDPQIKHG